MKKILLLLFMLFFGLQTFAKEENLGFRGPLNFFQSKVLEHIISSQIKNTVGGNIKTKINSYGAKALRNGIFKSAKTEGKNLAFEGISITSFTATTITENNRLDIGDTSNPKLLTDIQAEYIATLSNEDIKTIITAPICQKEILKFNKKLAPFAQIYDIDIFCKTNRLHFRINLLSELFGTNFSVSGSTDVYSDGNIAELRDIEFSKKIKLGLSEKAILLLNNLNPINLVIKELDDAHLDINVNKIKIIDDKIQIFGIIKLYRST